MIHSCCGCSCSVCDNGHATGDHTNECSKRFWAEQEALASQVESPDPPPTFGVCP